MYVHKAAGREDRAGAETEEQSEVQYGNRQEEGAGEKVQPAADGMKEKLALENEDRHLKRG